MLPRPPGKAAAAFKGCWRLLRAPAAVLGSFIHQRNAFNTPRVRRNTPRVCRQLHPPAQCRPRVQPSGAVGARRHALCSMAWQRKRPFWQQPVRGRCREPLRIAPKGPRSNSRNTWTKRRPGGGDDMGIYMHLHARRLHVHKHIHTQTRKLCSWAGLHPMRLCAYKEYRYIHECMNVYKYANIHTYIHTHMHISKHMLTYTHALNAGVTEQLTLARSRSMYPARHVSIHRQWSMCTLGRARGNTKQHKKRPEAHGHGPGSRRVSQ